jgi:hypothetical protein
MSRATSGTHAVEAGEPRFAPAALRRLLGWAIAVGRRRPALKDGTPRPPIAARPTVGSTAS